MKYFDLISKLDAQTRFLGLVATLLTAGLLFMSFTTYSLYSEKTVVILPPRVEKEFWVAGDTLSSSYLEQVAYYIADRMMTVSPQNVESSLDMIRPFFSTDPEDLKRLDRTFVRIAKTVRENDYYQVFYPLRFRIDQKNSRLIVEGMVRKMSGMQYIGQERKTVVINFHVRNGRFFVKGIEVN